MLHYDTLRAWRNLKEIQYKDKFHRISKKNQMFIKLNSKENYDFRITQRIFL